MYYNSLLILFNFHESTLSRYCLHFCRLSEENGIINFWRSTLILQRNVGEATFSVFYKQ